MEKSLSSYLKKLFLPLGAIFFLLSCASYLLDTASLSYLFQGAESFRAEIIPKVKISALPLQLIFVMTFLILSFKVRFEKIITYCFFGLLFVLTHLLILLQFKNAVAIPQSFIQQLPIGIQESFGFYLTNWVVILFRSVAVLMGPSLVSIIVWGFLNQLTKVQEGLKYYIPFAILLGFVGTIPQYLASSFFNFSTSFNHSTTPIATILSIAVAIICILFSLILFMSTSQKLSYKSNDEKEPKIERMPILRTAYLLGGCSLALGFLDMIFKIHFKEIAATPNEYSQTMGLFSTYVGIASLLFSFICFFLGSWSLATKGWRKTLSSTTFVLAISAAVFIASSFLFPSTPLWAKSLIKSLIISIKTALFFPLIQMIYLLLSSSKRFRYKVVIEMVAYPLIKGSNALIMQSLFILTISSFIVPYLEMLIFLFLVLLVFATHKLNRRIGSSLEDFSPPSHT